MIRSIAAISVLLVLGTLQCSAQSPPIATGQYTFGAYDNHGFDTINVGNLNVSFSIPVLHKAGRGLPFLSDVIFNSSAWYPVSISGSLYWNPQPGFGWAVNGQFAPGTLTHSTTTVWNPTAGCYYSQESNWAYRDPSNATHYFSGTMQAIDYPLYPGESGVCTFIPTAFTVAAGDGSAYSLTVAGDLSQAQISTIGSGSSVSFTQNSGFQAISVTDPNGNQISYDPSHANFTDTTGNVALQLGDGYPVAALTYKDTNGNSQTVTPQSTYYTVVTAFGCSNINDYNGANSLLTRLTFPDGSAYKFTYEPTPGYDPSLGYVTGRIASVTLPGGGVIAYTYTGANNGINCSDGSALGLVRTMQSDSPSTSWTYSRSTSSNGSHSNVVDALGNNYDYDFVTPTPVANSMNPGALLFEVNRNSWNGAIFSGPHALSRQTCYNASGTICIGSPVSLPVTQVDTYQTYTDSEETGATFKSTTSGLIKEVDRYDYGLFTNNNTDGRGPLLTKEIFEYGQCGPSNLISNDSLFDRNNNLISLTGRCYDQTRPVASSNVPGNVDAGRGGCQSLLRVGPLTLASWRSRHYNDRP